MYLSIIFKIINTYLFINSSFPIMDQRHCINRFSLFTNQRKKGGRFPREITIPVEILPPA